MRIESLRVQNYKVLRDVRLENVSPMAVLLGANGSGKSTLLDVFASLRDCVRSEPRGATRRGRVARVVMARGILREGRSFVIRLVLFVEEEPMKVLLKGLLPRFGLPVEPRVFSFNGKTDLQKKGRRQDASRHGRGRDRAALHRGAGTTTARTAPR